MSKKDRKDKHHDTARDNGKVSVAHCVDTPDDTAAISAEDCQC